MTAPPPGADQPAPTPWQQAQALYDAGKTHVEIRAALAAANVDAESIGVLLNSLPDAVMPSALPEAKLDLGVNPLAPGLFSVFELGLTGNPRITGRYWLVFGGVLGALTGLFMLVTALGTPRQKKPVTPRCSPHSTSCLGWGWCWPSPRSPEVSPCGRRPSPFAASNFICALIEKGTPDAKTTHARL
jgi:hypothetical protein